MKYCICLYCYFSDLDHTQYDKILQKYINNIYLYFKFFLNVKKNLVTFLLNIKKDVIKNYMCNIVGYFLTTVKHRNLESVFIQ